jgi:hypothetical protein
MVVSGKSCVEWPTARKRSKVVFERAKVNGLAALGGLIFPRIAPSLS